VAKGITTDWEEDYKIMLLEPTIEKLVAMKLHGMARSLKERASRPDHADLAVSDFVSFLVDDEWSDRQNRKLAARLRGARFKDPVACIEDIDYQTARGLKKSVLLELLQNHWLGKHQNIVLTGPAGSGKSYLAQAIGNHLCRSGHVVTYMRVTKLAFLLTQIRADGTYMRVMSRIAKARVLLLDDLGIGTLTDQQRADFLEILEDRYGQGSTIITSQMPTTAWHEYFGGGTVADGICDRFLHNAHRIDLRASKDSQRKLRSGLTPAEPSGNKGTGLGD
jgi:DNA replication protein DnaC